MAAPLPGNTNTDTYGYANCYTNCYANGNRDYYSYNDAKGYSYCDSGRHCHRHTCRDRNCNSYRDTQT